MIITIFLVFGPSYAMERSVALVKLLASNPNKSTSLIRLNSNYGLSLVPNNASRVKSTTKNGSGDCNREFKERYVMGRQSFTHNVDETSSHGNLAKLLLAVSGLTLLSATQTLDEDNWLRGSYIEPVTGLTFIGDQRSVTVFGKNGDTIATIPFFNPDYTRYYFGSSPDGRYVSIHSYAQEGIVIWDTTSQRVIALIKHADAATKNITISFNEQEVVLETDKLDGYQITRLWQDMFNNHQMVLRFEAKRSAVIYLYQMKYVDLVIDLDKQSVCLESHFPEHENTPSFLKKPAEDGWDNLGTWWLDSHIISKVEENKQITFLVKDKNNKPIASLSSGIKWHDFSKSESGGHLLINDTYFCFNSLNEKDTKVWNLASQKLVFSQETGYQMNFGGKDILVAGSGQKGWIKIWDIRSGALMGTYSQTDGFKDWHSWPDGIIKIITKNGSVKTFKINDSK